MTKMKFIGIIPARYDSTRFPGKPLAEIQGKTMINHVFEQTSKSEMLSKVIVATDDERIFQNVKEFGGNVMMTYKSHESGTARCNEVAEKLLDTAEIKNSDIIINIQGDEPFVKPEQINDLAACFDGVDVRIATLAKLIDNYDDLFDTNIVKVIFDEIEYAIYFSRSAIPFVRGKDCKEWLAVQNFYKHIGLYAYRADVLQAICKLKPSDIEVSESLEQLRWIANGYKIKVKITEYESLSIDTPEDLSKIKLSN